MNEAMRILLLLNGPKERYVGGADDARARVWGERCSAGTELTVGYLPSTTPDGRPTTIYPMGKGEAWALSDLYPDRCALAQAEGFDAVIIHCFADPGLTRTRRTVDIPVIGPGEVTLRAAAMLGRRIGLTMPSGESAVVHQAQVESLGMAEQVVGLEPVRVDLARFEEQDSGRMADALVEAAERLIERGAEVICPSGLAYIPIRVSAEAVSERLGVPVLDPSLVAIRTAEMLVRALPSASTRAAWAARQVAVTA
jgi:Asp/Glu/hydantoin racemase